MVEGQANRHRIIRQIIRVRLTTLPVKHTIGNPSTAWADNTSKLKVSTRKVKVILKQLFHGAQRDSDDEKTSAAENSEHGTQLTTAVSSCTSQQPRSAPAPRAAPNIPAVTYRISLEFAEEMEESYDAVESTLQAAYCRSLRRALQKYGPITSLLEIVYVSDGTQSFCVADETVPEVPMQCPTVNKFGSESEQAEQRLDLDSLSPLYFRKQWEGKVKTITPAVLLAAKSALR